MPTYEVTAPDGKVYEVTAPPGASQAQVLAYAKAQYGRANRPQVRQSPGIMDNVNALGSRLTNSLTLGLADDATGVGGSLSGILKNAVGAMSGRESFDPMAAAAAGFTRAKSRRQAEEARVQRDMPVASAVNDAVGFVGSLAIPIGQVGRAQTLGQMIRTGAKQGAIYGAIGGVGASDGNIAERAASAGVGAAGGAALGAVAPAAIRGAGNLVRGASRLAGRGQPIAPQIIAERLAADGVTPAQAGRVITEARARGVPLALADAGGDNVRDLAASVGRQPGASKTIIRDMAVARQEGQADRLTGAITRDLGPVTTIREQSDKLIAQAREAAAPLYEKAHAAVVPITGKLRALMMRPSMRGALAKAYRLAQEEGEDPTRLGFTLNDAGDVVIGAREPTMKTLDYVKRALDDVVEGYRDPTSGRLQVTGEVRAVNGTRSELINELDRLNPDYKAARAAYAGPVAARDALRLGEKALRLPPSEIEVAVSRMSDGELAQFRLGVRSALSDAINAKGDYADKVRMLIGSPKKRAVLDRAFRGDGGIENFARTLADEERAQRTYAAVSGNSATASRLAEDVTTGDGGLVNTATEAALASGSPTAMLTGAMASVIRAIRDNRVGKLGEEVRGQLAAALAETDPAILSRALRDAQRARAAERVGQRVNKRVAVTAGRVAGQVGGAIPGAMAGQ